MSTEYDDYGSLMEDVIELMDAGISEIPDGLYGLTKSGNQMYTAFEEVYSRAVDAIEYTVEKTDY